MILYSYLVKPNMEDMMLKILKDGDERLRKVSEPVKKIDDEVLSLASQMLLAMYDAEGVGLAAPQVGRNIRVVVVDIGDGPVTLINPAVIEASGEMDGPEGCLSFPGLTGKVKRYAKVVVKAFDREANEIVVDAEGFMARALQHEIDHLDGVLFIDKARDVKPNDYEESE